MAPFVVAAKRGLFAKEGISVSTNSVNGSIEAIAKVAAGESEMALVDINELIRWRDKPGAPPIKAVFVLFNQAPYSFVARKSRGIRSLADLSGKTVGVADSDFSFKLWPALARQNGIKADSLKIYKMSAAVREPILSAGQVDAVAGFSYLAGVNQLRQRAAGAKFIDDKARHANANARGAVGTVEDQHLVGHRCVPPAFAAAIAVGTSCLMFEGLLTSTEPDHRFGREALHFGIKAALPPGQLRRAGELFAEKDGILQAVAALGVNALGKPDPRAQHDLRPFGTGGQ